MNILIDTREQRPFSFPCPTTRATLPAGDYSILGLENAVSIERKSKADAYSTIGNGRRRFVRELEKLELLDYAAIVIECAMSDFLLPPVRSQLNPNSAINSLIAWSVRYNLPVFWCDTRLLAQTFTYRLLEKFCKELKVGGALKTIKKRHTEQL